MQPKENRKNFADSIASLRLKWRKKASYYHRTTEKYIKFHIPDNSSVLEIGCLTGELITSLKPRYGLGIDSSPNMIEVAQKTSPDIKFQIGDLENLNIFETFDYVIIHDVIGYCDNLQKAFTELKKVCRPDTKIILIYHTYLWRPILKLAELLKLRMKWPKQHWLSTNDLKNLLYVSGFNIIAQKQQILLPLNIPVLSTFFNKYIVYLPFFRKFALHHILLFQPSTQRKNPEHVSCSVIVPCRNEKGNIEQAVLRTPKMGTNTEIIFVEGHSKDGTREECERVKNAYPDKNIHVFVQKGKGKGDAVREGFSAARGDVLMILDADLTVPPESLPDFFNAIVSGKGEFINGSRLVYNMEKQAMRFLNTVANKTFSIILTYLLGQYLKDTLCGTKVLWREDYTKITEGRKYFGDFDPFGDFDLLFGAAKLNLKIVEIPVHYLARTYGSTQISRFRHGWLLLKMTVFAMRKIKFI